MVACRTSGKEIRLRVCQQSKANIRSFTCTTSPSVASVLRLSMWSWFVTKLRRRGVRTNSCTPVCAFTPLPTCFLSWLSYLILYCLFWFFLMEQLLSAFFMFFIFLYTLFTDLLSITLWPLWTSFYSSRFLDFWFLNHISVETCSEKWDHLQRQFHAEVFWVFVLMTSLC